MVCVGISFAVQVVEEAGTIKRCTDVSMSHLIHMSFASGCQFPQNHGALHIYSLSQLLMLRKNMAYSPCDDQISRIALRACCLFHLRYRKHGNKELRYEIDRDTGLVALGGLKAGSVNCCIGEERVKSIEATMDVTSIAAKTNIWN